jgi:hypothetical protein
MPCPYVVSLLLNPVKMEAGNFSCSALPCQENLQCNLRWKQKRFSHCCLAITFIVKIKLEIINKVIKIDVNINFKKLKPHFRKRQKFQLFFPSKKGRFSGSPLFYELIAKILD